MKTALILEGGAMRGIYTAGVLDPFDDKAFMTSGVPFYMSNLLL